MQKPIVISLVLLFSAMLACDGYAAESEPPKRVRVIFGYENTGRWDQLFTETLARVFLNDDRVTFQTDYVPLDVEDPASFTLFSTLEQFRSSDADIVITVRPQAAAFVHQWRDTFFPDIPRIYVSPDDDLMAEDLEPDTTVIIPSASYSAAKETLSIMPTLLPGLEHIYILSGESTADASYLKRIQNAADELGLQQTIHIRTGLTPSELSAELNNAPQNSAAIFGLYSRDRTGQQYRGGSIASLISEQSELPLFGLFDSWLNSGIVGGSMTSATLYGEKTATLALSLLFGDAAPASVETDTKYLFDARQLERAGINPALLPEGSELINVEPGLLQEYGWQFFLGVAVLLVQLFFITALWRSLIERKAAKIELEANRAAMLEAQRIAHVGSWQLDLATNQVKWTPELFLMQGLDPACSPPGFEEHSKLFTPESWKQLENAIAHTTESGEPYKVELEMVKPDGKHGWMSARGEVVKDDNGTIVGLRGTATDVTDLHIINEQLRRSQKMEAVGQLTGGIAHDFNNILAIIMGNLQLVKREVSGSEKLTNGIERALGAANRGTVLINKLLGFSRTNTSEATPVSLNQLITNMDDLLAKSLTVSIKIETQLAPDLWLVDVDEGDLGDAILNLALNARDAMPLGGKLVIETMNKTLDATVVEKHPDAEIGDYVMLSISDTGTGMSPEVQEKVLEPFFTTKTEGRGTGLGLSMVYGFAKRSGGFITIHSKLGTGTSINIFFPRGYGSPQVEKTTSEENELPRGQETVLVVDDEKELTKLAAANLESLGYTVLMAFDGRSALAVIEDNPNIDLVFSDVIMPGNLDGYDLAMTTKKTHPALKILLTSGFTGRKEDDASLKSDTMVELTRNLLRKPYSLGELAKAVRNALDV